MGEDDEGQTTQILAEESDMDEQTKLGGTSSEPCFCLLDGFFVDPESHQDKRRVTIPITKLPALLGRSHINDNPNFFGLGEKKALSREHFRIVYQYPQGGSAHFDHEKGKLSYDLHGSAALIDQSSSENVQENDPTHGFFVLECLGKNKVFVNGSRVPQGKGAILKSEYAIRVSSYTLYFLTPTDVQPSVLNRSFKKNKAESIQGEYDSLPTDILLTRMTDAIESGTWERKHGMLSATIALRAVYDAALDPRNIARAAEGKGEGIARTELMKWIATSPKYKQWVEQINAKMEVRSYQALISKTLLKAGYTRTGTSGRYVKWVLPENIPSIVKEGINGNYLEGGTADEQGRNAKDTDDKEDSPHQDDVDESQGKRESDDEENEHGAVGPEEEVEDSERGNDMVEDE